MRVLLLWIVPCVAVLCSSRYAFKEDIIINGRLAELTSVCLEDNSVIITAPEVSIDGSIEWSSNHTLTIISRHHITFTSSANIRCTHGGITLKAGIEDPSEEGTLIFTSPRTIIGTNCEINIHHNPVRGKEQHKYHNPTRFREYVIAPRISTYMLVNDAYDLGNIQCFFAADYALSRDIDLANMELAPIMVTRPYRKYFSGRLDGNNFSISNWRSLSPDNDDMGLFGVIASGERDPAIISNLILRNFVVSGDERVGALAGSLVNVVLSNIHLDNVSVEGSTMIGGVAGSVEYSTLTNISYSNITIMSVNYSGSIAGAIRNSYVDDITTVGYASEDNEREMEDRQRELIIRMFQYLCQT